MKKIEAHIVSTKNSIVNDYLNFIRSEKLQNDRSKFRHNVERIGEILAYEISKTLAYKTVEIQTVLGIKKTQTLKTQPVILSIMRAGLPLHNGFLHMFPDADSGFIGAARKTTTGNDFEIDLSYVGAPLLEGRTVILCDPMLATGRSVVKTIEALTLHGKANRVILASVIASEAGLSYVQSHCPKVDIWLADVDPILNDKSYIVPGLGDAGDLAYGPKL